jgi:branched-subunit amino acid aminotransferase/4-amino-4-deoxychorismate lyase
MRGTPHVDPNKGVFETMLVLKGRPVELQAHLDRLAASLAALFGAPLPDDARSGILAHSHGVNHGKLRVTIAPDAERMTTEIATTAVEPNSVFPSRGPGIALRSFVVEGGLGAHKWADRRLLIQAEAEAQPGELSLLVDADGAALEAARGSVFQIRDGCLGTPPTDGRILPSIARAQALEVARAEGIETTEETLSLDDLRRGGLFLAGSVRGIEPVGALDGEDLAPPGEISARIAAGLRRRWLRVPQAEPVAVVVAGRRAGRRAR